MVPSDNTKVIETPTSTFWFDQKGILCCVSRKANPLTLEESRKVMNVLKTFVGDQKVCMLVDISNSGESTKEVRDYAAEEFPKFIKALAMISHSELGKMLANLFFNLQHQPYPTKMFTNEKDAREWLLQYL